MCHPQRFWRLVVWRRKTSPCGRSTRLSVWWCWPTWRCWTSTPTKSTSMGGRFPSVTQSGRVTWACTLTSHTARTCAGSAGYTSACTIVPQGSSHCRRPSAFQDACSAAWFECEDSTARPCVKWYWQAPPLSFQNVWRQDRRSHGTQSEGGTVRPGGHLQRGWWCFCHPDPEILASRLRFTGHRVDLPAHRDWSACSSSSTPYLSQISSHFSDSYRPILLCVWSHSGPWLIPDQDPGSV